MSEALDPKHQAVGSMSVRLLAGTLLTLSIVQLVSFSLLREKISIIELICSLGLTYVNAFAGFGLYKVAFRWSFTGLLAVGVMGNFFRALFFATLICGIMSVGLNSPNSVLLVTLLSNLTVWMVEIGSLHYRTLNAYESS